MSIIVDDGNIKFIARRFEISRVSYRKELLVDDIMHYGELQLVPIDGVAYISYVGWKEFEFMTHSGGNHTIVFMDEKEIEDFVKCVNIFTKEEEEDNIII